MMKSHDFILAAVDTDSVSFSKPDMSVITKEEQEFLLKEINSQMPEKIQFAHDGYFPTVICLKAKNYIMQKENGDVKYKGSGLKDQKKPKAIQEFLKAIIDVILRNENNYTEVYNRYVREILELKDIKRWVTKRTLTENVFKSKRTNETKVVDAINGTEYVEGDKIWVFYKNDEQASLGLVEHYNNDHSEDRLLKQLFDASKVFGNILDVKTLFMNYNLKRNKLKLKELL